jgi:hypothetical protein
MMLEDIHLKEAGVKLTFEGTTSNSGTCPTLYSTDRGTYVVQGTRVLDPDALSTAQARGLPDHEVLVEIPTALLTFAHRETS